MSMQIRAFLLLLTVATSSGAAELVIPGVANLAGANGTYFVTDLTVTNHESSPVELALTYIEGSGATTTVSALLPPGTTTYGNVLESLFAKSESGGALILQAPASLQVHARTFNRSADGSYGLALPLYRREELLGEGETAHLPWISQSVDATRASRTNLALVFSERSGGSATVRIVDPVGRIIATKTYASATRAFVQQSIGELVADLPVGRVSITVERGAVAGYVSVVDNVSGDASVFPMQRIDPAATDIVIAGVARLPGANGTFFETDVRLINAHEQSTSVTASYLPPGSDNTVPSTTTTFLLAAKSTRHIADVLAELFNLPNGSSGAIRFQSDKPLLAVARTSNVDPSGVRVGAYGAQQSSVPFTRFTPAGKTTRLTAIRHDASFRTNIGLTAGFAGAVVDVTLRASNASIVSSVRRTLAVRSWQQESVGLLFPEAGAISDASVDISVVSGSVDAYASMVDQISGDSTIAHATTTSSACSETGVELSGGICVGAVGTARATYDRGASYRWTAIGATILAGQGTSAISFTPTSSSVFSVNLEIDSSHCTLRSSRETIAIARSSVGNVSATSVRVGSPAMITWIADGPATGFTLTGTDFLTPVTLAASATSYSYTPGIEGTKQVTVTALSPCGTSGVTASYAVTTAPASDGSGGTGGSYPGFFSFNALSGRTYNVYVPSRYSPSVPTPAVMLLGGQGQRAETVLQIGWQQIAERDNVILITLTPSSSGPGYSGAYDVAEFQTIEEAEREVPKRYNIALKQFYFWGFSAGAHVTYMFALTAERSQRVAAFAIQAGALEAAATRTNPPAWPPQSGARKLPVFISAGTADTTGSSGGLIGALRRNRDMLLGHGYPVVTREVAGQGHTYTTADVNEAWSFLSLRKLP